MTRSQKLIFLAGAFLLVMPCIAVSAESTLPLQERCAAGAAQLVGRLDSVVAYTSHYNKNRDQCFARVGFYFGQVDETMQLRNGRSITLKHPHWMVNLYRVFDSKIIGSCAYIGTSRQECWLGDTTQSSIEEFEALVTTYMEE